MSERIVIAVDGLSASGKGTLSALLAERLRFSHLDSGLLYRACALLLLEGGLLESTGAAQAEAVRALSLEIRWDGRESAVYSGSRRFGEELRSEEVSRAASQIAAQGEVRLALLHLQREFAPRQNLVADGRDMGTIVFPETPFKLFLHCDPSERAKRRFRQLQHTLKGVTLEEVEAALKERDLRDSMRKTAPVKPAEDAIFLDGTHETPPALVGLALKALQERGLNLDLFL